MTPKRAPKRVSFPLSAAAAARRDDHIQIGDVLQQFTRRRALSRDDRWVIVWRDECQPALFSQPPRQRLAILGLAVIAHDLGAVAARRLDLDLRRVSRHAD